MKFFRKKLGGLQRGEDFLAGVDSIVLTLENGDICTARISDELNVPDDPRELLREARRAPARYAFWAYQAERALSKLRSAEARAAEEEGLDYIRFRTYIQEHTLVEMATEANIRAHMNASPSADLKTAKNDLSDAQLSYGVLRSLRDASEHRSHLLRRLIARETEPG